MPVGSGSVVGIVGARSPVGGNTGDESMDSMSVAPRVADDASETTLEARLFKKSSRCARIPEIPLEENHTIGET